MKIKGIFQFKDSKMSEEKIQIRMRLVKEKLAF